MVYTGVRQEARQGDMREIWRAEPDLLLGSDEEARIYGAAMLSDKDWAPSIL